MSLSAIGWLQSSLGLDISGEWNQIVSLCVGGITYMTVRRTFHDYTSNPIFGAILSNELKRNEDGSFIIDHDGTNFRFVLNFMRSKQLLLPDEFAEWDILVDDARYFKLEDMEQAIFALEGYKKHMWLKAIPPAVFLTWDINKKQGQVVPNTLPHFAASVQGGLEYQGRPVETLNEAVFILLSAYFMEIQHWQKPEAPHHSEHHVFFSRK